MCHALVTHSRIRIISIRRQKMRGTGVVTSLFGVPLAISAFRIQSWSKRFTTQEQDRCSDHASRTAKTSTLKAATSSFMHFMSCMALL